MLHRLPVLNHSVLSALNATDARASPVAVSNGFWNLAGSRAPSGIADLSSAGGCRIHDTLWFVLTRGKVARIAIAWREVMSYTMDIYAYYVQA